MGLITHLVVLAFGAVVILCAVAFVVADMFGRVDYLKVHFPGLENILARRSALVVSLLVAILLLIGDAFELVRKEIPEAIASPVMVVKPPLAPIIQEGSPRVITRTLPAPEEPPRVTLWNYPQKPKGNAPGGKYATDFIVITNKKLESPVRLLFDCDHPILFAIAMVGNSLTISKWTQERAGQLYMEINLPTGDPYVPIVVTVETAEEVKARHVQILTR